MSNSIKRYKLKRFAKTTPAPPVAKHLPKGIFRAIKVTENNHQTIKDFVTGPYVDFILREDVSKSRHTKKVIVRARTPQGWTTARADATYIYRTEDGKFFCIPASTFELLTTQTHVRIKN